MLRFWIFANLLLILFVQRANAQIPITSPIRDNSWLDKYNFYKPIGETENRTPLIKRGITTLAPEDPIKPYVPPGLTCPNPPSANDITNSGFQFTSQLLTTSQATSLNVPYLKASGGANAMVVVREYIESLPCTASDTKTLLIYGSTVRTVITVEDYQAKLGLSLPVIAADATLNHKSSKLNIEVKGLSNPKFSDMVANLAGKDFTVETYTEYMTAEAQLVKLVSDPLTKATPTLLGVTDPSILEESQLNQASVIAWALTQVAAKRSCDQALSSPFASNAKQYRSWIIAVYKTITGSCDGTVPGGEQAKNASKFLIGLRMVKK